ncbi:preprotein translocase subunit SecA [Candidatus Falkowbacteria bacterium CG10_big_fil_rev_8_21_14_0_10_37_14]|uniref:Protein translocase subunit SecA n=1 Tax=Candidatus Falkowbacteria bacterium CG10_big_fil_rev_8_21_14_0_10_37_14 TaxID=1974561 RepID=A0A2M6WT42_9BACT|nr:preprotein translocase subunit SecA [Candidatus Falkowbacteria bacterium]PIT95945.1 MAG: preprotein translocase subunit SecA [Candidatus Falkowbacteria bacterium CG10_big_fil_rev_8_21_14_0_10_37_14]
MSFLTKLLGDPNEKVIKEIRESYITKINDFDSAISALSDEELKAKTTEFRARLGVELVDGKLTNSKTVEEEEQLLLDMLPEAFAVAREAGKRTIKQRHFDVQLVGGVVLHRGQIAEMKTGEGKTLVATLALYLNSLTARGVHLVTVNDYLSRVGAGWMAPLFYTLGLSTSVIIHDTAYLYDPEYIDDTQYDPRLAHFKRVGRKEAYLADITYGTNNEFGFDYLRDNMVPTLEARVQRDLHYAIVDEVDSILIDEARTPLIISGSMEESSEKYYKFAEQVRRLELDVDYNVDEKMRSATLTEEGVAKMEKYLGVENIYVTGGIKDIHHIEQALKAHALFKIDRDYVVKDGEVVIVDEFTGRMMQGRRYSEGLHQAIEAKEGVAVQKESQTLATVTFQNYFRMYYKLAGMTGTAMTEAEEFHKIYNLEVSSIPTNKPVLRSDLNDLIYAGEKGKYQALITDVKERHANGQPVLIGTISISKNEELAHLLELEGVPAQVLNAKQHEQEAPIIAQAGKSGSVTIATNMAGRGVDIILGGSPFDKAEYEKVVNAGGLHVIGTERHESRRIDNQLRGRAGRQGDPGSSRFYLSMEDDLLRIFGGERLKGMMKTLKLPEDMPIENKMISRSIEQAQKRVEGDNFDTRKHLVEYDDVINKHRESIYRKRLQILKISEGQVLGDNEPRSLKEIILDMVNNEIETVVSFHTAAEETADWNFKEISEVVNTIFKVGDLSADLKKLAGENDKLDKVRARNAIVDRLTALALENYEVVAKFSDGQGMPWVQIEKAILLRAVDDLWIEHLETMDYLRKGIGLRGYGQRDPLVEYKKESFRLYNELNELIQKQVTYAIYKVGGIQEVLAHNLLDQAKVFSAPAKTAMPTTSNNAFASALSGAGMMIAEPKSKDRDEEGNKVGRNDLCPCGSGKKYKKCHGK